MMKINITDVTNNATCSTINDIDIDVADEVATIMPSNVAADMADDVSVTTQFWKGPIQSGLISAQHSLLAKHIELYTQPI